MRVMHNFGLVRIINTEQDPRECGYNIRVETLNQNTNEWSLYHGFNTISDDYAYTNAREAAGRAIKEIARENANAF